MEQKVEISKSDHALDLLARFNEFRKTNKHCDFIIRAGDKEMPVHKFVISASSEYFEAMLSHDTKENNEGIVEMKQVDPDCIVKCVEFMYTGEASVSEENQSGLMHVAHMLQLKRLYNGVAIFLEKKLDSSSFFSTRETANLYNCDKLVEVCDKFAFEHFRDIAKLDGFNSLEVDYINFLLSSDELKVSDDVKCKSLMTWINYDVNRATSLFDLMKNIDFCQVSMTYRRFLAENEPVVTDSMECLKYIMKSVFDSGNTEASDMTLDDNHGIIVLDSKSRTLKCFDLQTKTWSNKQAMHPNMVNRYCSVVLVEENIYVLTHDRLTYRVHSRQQNSRWEQLANRNGCWGDAVALNGMIYCTEHYQNYNNRLERYDTHKNRWSFTLNRSTQLLGCAITVMQGDLVLLGGQQVSGIPVNTVQRFHPTTSSWSNAPSLRRARRNASTVTMNGDIFIFGGMNTNSHEPSLEVLYHNANSWQLINFNGFSRQNFSSHTADGKIYLVGNNVSGFKTIDEYDPNTSKLRTVTSFNDMTVHYFSSLVCII